MGEYLASNECELCERIMPLSKHHLYPKDQHKRLIKQKKMSRDELLANTTEICRPCHSAIHRFFTNRVLADRLHSIELLIEEEKIIDWVKYARKQRTYTKKDSVTKGFKYAH